MGTYVTIKIQGASQDHLVQISNEAFAEIFRVDSLTSVFSSRSAVYMLNTKGRVVSAELVKLLNDAHRVWAESRGAFDPTVMPLIKAWGFYDTTAQGRIPSREDIRELLRFVDFGALEVTEDTVQYKQVLRSAFGHEMFAPGIDLGGIAKGYAVDRAVAVLRENGISYGLVDAGGDIFCFGKKKGGWKIGIRNPRGKTPQELVGIITLDSGAVATSGDYENFFFFEGTCYHHLLDPKTGMPARGQISATVTAASATLADAWATALFVMGKDGIAVLDSLEGLEGLLILEDGSFMKTKGFPEIKKP